MGTEPTDGGSQTAAQSENWSAARKRPVEVEYRGPYTDPAVVETLEGDFEVDEEYVEEHGGFVIINGVDGEEYPCALDIFEETYEPLTGQVSDDPITDQEAIATVIEQVEAGDELTVAAAATENERQYMDNREVVFNDSGGAQFGDPVKDYARILDVVGEDRTPTVYELGEDPDRPKVNGREITKLWAWEFSGDLESIVGPTGRVSEEA